MQQPDPKVRQKEIPCLHDSLVYYEQADSYRRAATENQTADKGTQAARYHRPEVQGQPHHTGYRELGGSHTLSGDGNIQFDPYRF